MQTELKDWKVSKKRVYLIIVLKIIFYFVRIGVKFGKDTIRDLK